MFCSSKKMSTSMAFISLIVFRQSTVFLANLDSDFVTMMSIFPAFASFIILAKPLLSIFVPVMPSSE